MPRMQRVSLVLAAALVSATAPAQTTDPLASWNDGKAKQAILKFVAEVTSEGAAFVEPAERIAVFDNDGTLWSEQPIYFQLAFALDQVKAMAPQHPEWKTQEPYKTLLAGDVKGALAQGEKAILGIMAATHSGMTTEEFAASVEAWAASAKHPKQRSALHRDGLPAHARAARATCAGRDSRPSSSPAAASSSCAPGPRRPTASRPSRWWAAAASRSSSCGRTAPCC